MRRLVWESSFRKAFKRATRRAPDLSDRVFRTLQRLVENPSDPALKTHKLSGRLSGLWACWVEYDCRIIFAFKLTRAALITGGRAESKFLSLDALSVAQKRNKIQNLLASMSRRDRSIVRSGPKQQAVWRVAQPAGTGPKSKIDAPK